MSRHSTHALLTELASQLANSKLNESAQWCHTREIVVQRSFTDFEEYWTIAVTGAARLSADLATMAPANVEQIKTRARMRLTPDISGKITCSARANAVKGRLSK